MTEYYKTLRVPESATERRIREAYKELKEKYNPDKHKNNPLRELAAEEIIKIEKAYDFLVEHNMKKNEELQRKNESLIRELEEEIEERIENLFEENNTSKILYTEDYYTKKINSLALYAEPFYKKYGFEKSAYTGNQCLELARNIQMARKLIEELQEVVLIDESRYEAYNLLGICYITLGNFEKTEDALTKAVNRGDRSYLTLFNLGLSLMSLKKYKQAAAVFINCMDMHGEEEDVIGYIALSYQVYGSKALAKDYWRRLRYLNPNHELLDLEDNFLNKLKNFFE